jgi:hypothetical protein
MIWFKQWGWVYRPVSLAGWTIAGLTLAGCLWVTFIADRNSHSVSDTLIGAYPYAMLFIITSYWVASNTSRIPPR